MYHPICLPHNIICLSHTIQHPSVCHMLYHSQLSVTFCTTPFWLSHTIPVPFVIDYITPICLSHAIPFPFVCHMLYHSHLFVTFYTTSIYHMLYHSHLSVTCYTTPIYHMLYHSHLSITCYTTPIYLSHVIPLPSVYHMLYHSHLSVTCYIVILSFKILEFDWLKNIWQKILLLHRVPKSHPPSNNSWQKLTMHDNG
jgi:hypothetical protein